MPTYEYECRDCGSKFIELKPLKDSSLDQPCPECKGSGRRVILTAPAWRPCPGMLTYDRRHNFPGGFKAGGTSSGDKVSTEDW